MKRIVLNVFAITLIFTVGSFTLPGTSFAPVPLPGNTQINFLNFGDFYAIKYVISGMELFTEETIGDSGTITNPSYDEGEPLGHKYWYPWQACAHLEIWTKSSSGSSWSKLGDMYANVLNSSIQDEMILTLTCNYLWWVPPA